ncbi:MAG: HEAT repeat domain-containing protein [Alphaproteobacteria bacterium]|nr:HEAT repeat domain-containing protein [Alphaproteobacteria bacterium]
MAEALAASEFGPWRAFLCNLAGDRHDESSVSILIGLLADPEAKVRNEAVDALARIADPRAGAPLLHLLLTEPRIDIRRGVLMALGAVNAREAVPLLLEYLRNPDAAQRGGAAWSLGRLGAIEARTELEEARGRERNAWASSQMTAALQALSAG